jgi:hypothetical protein
LASGPNRGPERIASALISTSVPPTLMSMQPPE